MQPRRQPTPAGRAIRARRLELGLSLAEVHIKSRVSIGSISGFETGRIHPSMPLLRRIAEALGMPVPDAPTMRTSDEVSDDGSNVVRFESR